MANELNAVEEQSGVQLYCGSSLVSSSTVMSGVTLSLAAEDCMKVYQGGTAENTAVEDGGMVEVFANGLVIGTTVAEGNMTVFKGGTANTTGIQWNGALYLSGGMASGVVVSDAGNLYVNNGGSAETVSIGEGGYAKVSDGVLTDVTLSGGETLTASLVVADQGTARNVMAQSNSNLNVTSGGQLAGTLQIAAGATVSVAADAVIDFTVAEQVTPETALINDWSLISGGAGASYTITVDADQKSGDYVLAGGAADFAATVTVKTTAGSELGTLAVGETKTFEGVDYTLAKNDSVLSLTIVGAEPPPTVYTAKSDVDGNGISDVMFQYTGGDYQIGFWMNGSSTWQATGVSQPETWELLGNYDMDNNGKADQVMVGNVEVSGVKGAYIGFYKDGDTTSDGWQNIGYLSNSENIAWKNVVGNLTGNAGANSIVWHAAELGVCGVWTDGTDNWVSLGNGFDANWELQGCGDFTGDGADEVLWKYNSTLYTTDINGNFATLGSAAGLTVRAIGDFSGDGIDDIVLFSEENGVVLKYENGLEENWSLLGQLDASDWFIVGAGDYNNDQIDDLLVRQYSTGMLGYYSAGDMSQWVEMGRGVDMQWTVIA